MKRNSKSVSKFLEGKSTTSEADEIMRMLNSEPITVEEWREWNETKADKLSNTTAKQMTAAIIDSNTPPAASARVLSMYRLLRAAAVLLVIAGGAALYLVNKAPSRSTPATTITIAVNEKIIANNSTDTIVLMLADSSRVNLFPESVIRYNDDSIRYGSKRNIYLTGSGHFTVARDAHRPFTVFSKSLYTTALGTSFDVIETSNSCFVKLYTGKVVVGEINSRSWKGAVTLSPGQLVDLHGAKRQFDIRKKPARKFVAPTVLTVAAAASMQFENTSLADVFKTLQHRFNRKISFDTTIAKELFFTGEVLANDSLPPVIKIICNMNGLSVVDSAGVLVVKP